MRRTLSLSVSLALGALTLLAGSAQAQIRVRVGAPPTPAPEVVTTAVDCNAYVAFVPKRQRCLACVNSGRRFFRQGDGGAGYCETPNTPPPPPHHPVPPPPPPAGVEYLRSPQQCAQFITNPQKRARCFQCVRQNATFNRQGEHGFGACMVAATPPPPPPVVEALRTVQECTAYCHNPAKRSRCTSCVSSGGTFYRQGDHGYGNCAMPPPPPPPPVELTSVGACFSQISHPGTRNHCRKCVEKGGRWSLSGNACLQGGGHGGGSGHGDDGDGHGKGKGKGKGHGHGH